MADQKLILIVDDDYELSDGIRAVLETQGHKVMQARDGQQGQTMIYNNRPDLVILDMMMPRKGGYPVLEHFRDKKDAPPIIMITANEGSRHKAYAEYLGVIDYIRKPFPPPSADLDVCRHALLAEQLDFGRMLAERQLQVRDEDFAVIGEITTPAFSPLRYATTFFVAHLPANQTPIVWPGELQAGEWI